MKTVARLLVYIAIIECFYFVLLGRGPNYDPPPNNTLAGDMAFYFGAYAVRWGLWILIYEGVYRALRWNARRRRDSASFTPSNVKHLFPGNDRGNHAMSPDCWCHPQQVDGFMRHRMATELLYPVFDTRPIDRP